MRHAMRLLPAAILTVAVWIMPMSAHAQFGRVYTTTITSPAAGAVIVTPTGQITVTGKTTYTGIFGANVTNVQVSLFDPTGKLCCQDQANTKVIPLPQGGGSSWSNNRIGNFTVPGAYTIKVQALDGANPQNLLGAAATITVNY